MSDRLKADLHVHGERAFVEERTQTHAALVGLVLEVDAVHVSLQVGVVPEDLLAVHALRLLGALVLHAHVLGEERLARVGGAAQLALVLLVGVHAHDVTPDLARHAVLVEAYAALEASVVEDLHGVGDLSLLLVVRLGAVAARPVGVVETLRVEHAAARLTHHLALDGVVAVVHLLVLVVALARRQHLAADLAHRPPGLLVLLLHVAVEEDLRAERARALVAVELLLAVRVARVTRHLASDLVRVGTQLTAVHGRLAVAVDVAGEVLDAVAHEGAVWTRVDGLVAQTQLVAHAVRLLALSVREVHGLAVLLQVVGLRQTGPTQVALEQARRTACNVHIHHGEYSNRCCEVFVIQSTYHHYRSIHL